MAISSRLQAFLTQHRIPFTVRQHPLAYTAQEIAASQHVSGKQVAKCVVAITDSGACLAVLPAHLRVDLAKLKALVKAKRLLLAKEPQIRGIFTDVDPGAMSVFGNLYDVPTVVDKSLASTERIVCNAGSHRETVTIRYDDFARHAKPRVGVFAMEVAVPKRAGRRTKPGKTASKKPRVTRASTKQTARRAKTSKKRR